MAKKKIKKTEEVSEINKEEASKTIIKKQDNQLKWFLIIIVFVFVSIFLTYFYVQSLNKFEYAGVNWEKIDYSGLTFYRGQIPPAFGSDYILNLRNDPRENNISINAEFKLYPNIIISLSPEAGSCRGASLPQLELGRFLGVIGAKTESAVNDKETAEVLNVTYATCDNAINNKTVLLIQKSDSPLIEQDKENKNCYIINVGECENIATIERFIVGIIAQVTKKQI